MEQRVARLAPVLDGLSNRQHPMGNCVYAVRAGERFIYIGKTVKGAWHRIRQHGQACDPLWAAWLAEWPRAADWRVEVCDFRDEPGTYQLEGELIRKYRPFVNITYNTERRPTVDDLWELEHNAFGPACETVLATGWPSFPDIALETLPDWNQALLEPRASLDTALSADPDGLAEYNRLFTAEQAVLQHWIANALTPAKTFRAGNSSKGLARFFSDLGFEVSHEAFRGAMMVAGYTPVWHGPNSRTCEYYARRAMRTGQSEPMWRHRTQLDYVTAFAYTWYWTTDALMHYYRLLAQLGESTAEVRKYVLLLLKIQQRQRVERQQLPPNHF